MDAINVINMEHIMLNFSKRYLQMVDCWKANVQIKQLGFISNVSHLYASLAEANEEENGNIYNSVVRSQASCYMLYKKFIICFN